VNKTRDQKAIEKFGAHLRLKRKERKLTLKDLAFEADIELSQIYRIEHGKINPTLTTLKALAKALDIPFIELMDF
jgi:transcriptional regulator with XRE-family HTH domain